MFTAQKTETIMNAPQTHSTAIAAFNPLAQPRYRVSLHSASGDDLRSVTLTNSATDAVRDFLRAGPLADGSDLFIWDRQKKEIVARVDWIDESNGLGSTIRVRTNQFYDRSLAEIAHRLCHRMDIRRAIVNGIAV